MINAIEMISHVLVDSSAKSIVIFIVILFALLAIRLLRSGHDRVHAVHRIWVFMIVSMLLLPVLSFALPGLSLPIPFLKSRPVETADLLNAPTENVTVANVDTAKPTGLSRTDLPDDLAIESLNPYSNVEASPVAPPAKITSPVAGEMGGSQFQLETEEPSHSTSLPWTSILTITWSLVCFLLLLKIAAAKFFTRRLLGRATKVESTEFGQAVGRVSFVESEEVNSPAVTGLLSHTIILPALWRQWDEDKLDAVLAHELAHIHRRDGIVVLLSKINTALFWFNPISWVANAKVNRLAELACDQRAALELGDRVGYARQLLEIAAVKMGHGFQPGIAMATPTGISERIEILLDTTQPFARKASRVFVAALLMVGVPALMVIAAAQPGDDEDTGEKAAEDWIRTVNGETVLTFRGEIVLEDGKPAVNALLRVRCDGNWIDVDIDGNEFEFDLTLENWHLGGLKMTAVSEDGESADAFIFYSNQLRVAASQYHTLTLKPTQSFDFKVHEEGTPVSGAHVAVNTRDYFSVEGITDDNGIATLRIPVHSTLNEVLVKCDDGLIGGYSFDRDPVRDPNLPLHEIEVSFCVDQKIRLIDFATKKPLVGFKFESHVATSPEYNFLPRDLMKGLKDLVTDENGEAVDRWFPGWEQVHFYPDLDREFEYGQGWSKAGDGKSKLIDGVFVCEFEQPPSLKRLPFKGKLSLPDGVKGGFEVCLTSYQHPEEGRYDPITCRTDIDGNFTGDVIRGATYSIAVNDPVWASEAWVGILAGPGSEKVPAPKINIFKGEPIKVTVTSGPDRQPIRNTVVAFSSRFNFEWTEDGDSQSGSDSLQWWATTDENGIARTTAAPGKFRTHIYNPDWRPSQEFEIEKGKPTELVFHRESAGKRSIRGKLALPAGAKDAAIDLSETVVELRAIDGETKSKATVSTDKNGNFSVEMAGAVIGGYARTADGKYVSTFFINELGDKLHKATLVPLISYRGKVVDADDEPIEKQELELRVVLQEDAPMPSSGFVRSRFDIDTLTAITDSNGLFEFMVPPDMPCRLYYRTKPATDRNNGLRRYGERHFLAGEDRPLDIVKLGESPTPKLTVKQTVAWKVNDCRLNHTRHLFVLEGESDSVFKFLKTALNENSDDGRDLCWYGITKISAGELLGAESKEFWGKYKAQLPKENEVAFVVLGHEAEEINSITVDTTADSSYATVADFVKANRIENVDGQKTLDDALALAKSTDRKVWLQFSQTRCGPCFLLSRWIDKHKDVLEKAYVFIKVDNIRDENGQDIWKKYVGERSMGIPFCVVLDDAGNVLEESLDFAKSNIGFPSTFEDGRAYRRIFEATAKGKLSAEEIDKLIKSID